VIQSGTGSAWRSLNGASGRLPIIRVGRLRRGIELSESATPAVDGGARRRSRESWWSRVAPLGAWRADSTASLIRLGMDVLGEGSAGLARCAALAAAQQLEAGLDMDIARVELRSALVCVQGVVDLVVA
jgi:hypothetical protein